MTWTIGIPDEEFHQRRPLQGLITKAEVRVIALSKLRIRPDSVVWDIGAGSGSVSIEAALLAPKGHVYAIERGQEDLDNVLKNIEKFGTSNVTTVLSTAPNGLEEFSDPDAVFIGGTAGHMAAILEVVAQRLRPDGRVVIDAATMENLHEGVTQLKALGFATEVILVSISRSKDIVNLTRFEALNPVFVIAGWRDQTVDPINITKNPLDMAPPP